MKLYLMSAVSVLLCLALLWALPGLALADGIPTATPAPARPGSGTTVHLPLVRQAPASTTPTAVVPVDGKWVGYLDDSIQYYLKFSVLSSGTELDLKEIYANFNGQCDVNAMEYGLSDLPSVAVEKGAFTFQVSNANTSVKVTGVFATPTSASGTYRISITRPWTNTGSIILPPCTYTATGTWVSTGP